MKPRNTNSKKWTPFPKDFLVEIKKALGANFPDQATNGEFIADGRIFSNEVLVRLGHLPKGLISQANAEVSITYDAKKENVKQVIDVAIDCAGSILQSHFDGDEELPRQWTKFEVGNKDVFIQFSTINTRLEAQADEFLRSTDPDLIEDDLQSEDLVKGEDFDQEVEALKKVFNDEEN